ncbi:hypothetical protein D0469_12500 [Peribacillus saganii]|uniref:NodB homology domain-containing protein n=1 Tax=Peribacillus saganii TaxID=2303992 RepID=A0A372LND3_9BACI|nr:polysaccharide deacetylase family protein [Peribacillus saganii]RFU68326.1 hypothetical protein D0469_12500 [Peribacillus saganii]
MKYLWFLGILFILFWPENVQAAQAETKVRVAVNDRICTDIKHGSMIMNGRAYIAWDDFVKITGAMIQNNSISKTATIKKGNITVSIDLYNGTLQLGNNSFKGEVVEKDEITYIPIRLVSEYLGYRVYYLSDERIVRLVDGNHKYSNGQFIKTLHKAAAKKVYLTFDDGPRAHTAKLLKILAEKNAKATFFLVEPNMKQYPQFVKQIVKSGHYVGLHSVSHDKNKLYGNPKNVVAEMDQTRKTLYSLTNLNSRLVRVPYGSKPFMTAPFRNGLVSSNFKMWDWDIDTLDWKYHKNNPSEIIKKVKSGLETYKNQDRVVILLHDVEGTINTLPIIIDVIKKAGYSLETYNPEEHFTVNFWKDKRL